MIDLNSQDGRGVHFNLSEARRHELERAYSVKMAGLGRYQYYTFPLAGMPQASWKMTSVPYSCCFRLCGGCMGLGISRITPYFVNGGR